MMDRICEVYIDELVDEPHDKQLAAFLYYFRENQNKISSKYG
jgi:hypothetical protein